MEENVSTISGTSGQFNKVFDTNGVPVIVLKWSIEDVEMWITDVLNFPQYAECFTSNFINGKKLIHMDASHLPKIGITDFEHIKTITKAVRAQLGINAEKWDRPIALPPKDTVEHFLERKAFSGAESNGLTFEEHVQYLENFREHGVP